MANQEKFKTMIGGQALIEGLMMRGPQKDAIVVRGKEGLTVEVNDRKIHPHFVRGKQSKDRFQFRHGPLPIRIRQHRF